MWCEEHKGLGCEVNRLRTAAQMAIMADDHGLARNLEAQADLLEDSVKIYHLWTPPRSKPSTAELMEMIQETISELAELQDRNAQTTCPVCIRHRAESYTRQIKTIMEYVNES